MARADAQHLAHRTRVEPVRVRDLDTSARLATVALRIVGYHFVCTCGSSGMLRARHSTAAAEALWHAG